MRIAISAPTGYNAREILLPLKQHLDADRLIESVLVITPAAPWQADIFPAFGKKYCGALNPSDLAGHQTLLRNFRPDIVITPTIGLDLNDIMILRAAKRLGIPTLTFVASWDNVFKMERLMRRGHSGPSKGAGGDYEQPDYFAVWNELNRDHVQRLFPNLGDSTIRITGPPRFDYFAHRERIPSRESLLAQLELPTTTASLIHGATTELYPFGYIWRSLAQALDHRRLVAPTAFYASVHPGGDISKHDYARYSVTTRYSFGRREPAPHPDFRFLPTDEETYLQVALFTHADLLINQSSTVAIESMRANVPVINVAYGQRLDWWRWRRSMVYRDFREHYRYLTSGGGTTVVKNERDFIAAVNRYLKDPPHQQAERASTVKKLITYTDGSCGQRLLDFAKEIARM